ncbi:ribonuclease catalytic domain-containing protein [Candidatus Poseidonia alphae]|nr:ribonuclease catalytic domain-containing protein [Candidatus Poseidonia alphae]
MNNSLYEDNYSKIVEPKYGNRRDNINDKNLTRQILNKHQYSINDRVDMTIYDTYSIDPIGCKDADDAFSIYTENDKLYFAIHIADPTEYIELNSELWKDIINRTTTKYPSNRPPIHMMPDKVLELSSLQGTYEGNTKNAITILTQINSTTYEPINEIKLLFTTIYVKKDNAYSYNSASAISNELSAFHIGLKISEVLKSNRSLKTKGIKLNEVSTSYPVYNGDDVYLYEDTKEERLMKQMIAEFAIFANSFVGEYLKINLNTGIFRTCNASEWLQTIYNEISGEELLQEIITNGIRADYMSNIASHDLVGMPEYCHFTSPIRRLSDCICHYLLKYIYFNNNNSNYNIPFSEQELDQLATKCMKITRFEKKNQYLDIKFRLLQVMHNMILKNKKIDIEYYITSYSGLFLNIIICKINRFNVHMSYTLRIRDYLKDINPKEKYFLTITQVNCFTNYDENTIPELDNSLIGEGFN